MSPLSNQEIKINKETYKKGLPQFSYLFVVASVVAAILLLLAIYAHSLGNIGKLLITLGCNLYIVFNLIKGILLHNIMDSHINLVLSNNISEELARQSSEKKEPIRRTFPYIYAIIITIIVQYGWFLLEFQGVGQYIMMGFIYLVVTTELYFSFQIKKQVDWIKHLLSNMIKDAESYTRSDD